MKKGLPIQIHYGDPPSKSQAIMTVSQIEEMLADKGKEKIPVKIILVGKNNYSAWVSPPDWEPHGVGDLRIAAAFLEAED